MKIQEQLKVWFVAMSVFSPTWKGKLVVKILLCIFGANCIFTGMRSAVWHH